MKTNKHPISVMLNWVFLFCLFAFHFPGSVFADQSEHTLPLPTVVVHVTVALCDNESQGIVPVGNSLCIGSKPNLNLYWGALYGVKTFFSRKDDWHKANIESPELNSPHILERVAFYKDVTVESEAEKKSKQRIIVVADAWHGDYIKTAIIQHLKMTAGDIPQELALTISNESFKIQAGGRSDLTAFIGHNGLMDFTLPPLGLAPRENNAKPTIVLACYSDKYFASFIRKAKALPLLTTNGLMAPEAYTLEAAINTWFTSRSIEQTHEAAAQAYAKYQKANVKWARRLFSSSQ